MFYGLTEFFLLFLDYFLSKNDYPAEPLSADGTLLHAIERIYTLLSASHGYNVASLSPCKPVGSITSPHLRSLSKRKIIVFPVFALINSCNPGDLAAGIRLSLPFLYQSLMIAETQKPTQSNRTLYKQLNWFRPGNYPYRIKAWILKKLRLSHLSSLVMDLISLLSVT
jgi:hypothetical protein